MDRDAPPTPDPGDSKASSVRRTALVLLSGGMDSACLAALYLSDGWTVVALFVDYGQPARIEEASAATAVANAMAMDLQRVQLVGVPRGPEQGAMPGRNAFLLSAALAVTGDSFDVVGLGIHSRSPYWDCTPEFVKTMQAMYDGYTLGIVRIGAPFLHWTKREILTLGKSLEAPLQLTYSCDQPNGPCEVCGSCRDVADATA